MIYKVTVRILCSDYWAKAAMNDIASLESEQPDTEAEETESPDPDERSLVLCWPTVTSQDSFDAAYVWGDLVEARPGLRKAPMVTVSVLPRVDLDPTA